MNRRRLLLTLGALLAGGPFPLVAQTISSAANQLFHVSDPATTISPITVLDGPGGNVRRNRDIRIVIPPGFNMTWDVTVTTATITGNAANKVATAVTYANGNKTVVINVLTNFTANNSITIAGLRFTNFTATSAANNLILQLRNNGVTTDTDNRTIQIDPFLNVSVTPAITSITGLPTNGVARAQAFTLTNTGSASDSYDLLTTRKPGTALTTVSITGTGITQGANPDSARRAALANGASVTVTVNFQVGNVAAGTIDTLFLTGRSVGNPAKTSVAALIVTVIRPAITIGKVVNPGGTQLPGTDLTFTSAVTNVGTASAASLMVVDSIPTTVQFKLSSASAVLPAGVTAAIEYSNNGGATWTYVPVSGGCAATAGFDRCVNRIRWRLLAPLSNAAPNNAGTLSFVARIR
ncbi:MAG TPA: hypothetical protein VH539_22895 [Gemmatimonadaceae bacterium]|jgi:hypothetical protein